MQKILDKLIEINTNEIHKCYVDYALFGNSVTVVSEYGTIKHIPYDQWGHLSIKEIHDKFKNAVILKE